MGASKLVPLIAGLLWAAPALAREPTDPSGVWLREDGRARVEIAPCGTELCATLLWSGDTSGGEAVGDRIYAITIEVGWGSLTTRGCVLVILCRNVAWTLAE